MKKLIHITANLNIFIGLILITAPIVYLLLYNTGLFEPAKVYATNSKRETEIISKAIESNSSSEINKNNISDYLVESVNIPENGAVDNGARIKIDSIGLDTNIYESWNADLALEKGVWRMPDQGTPITTDRPLVLSAHRWGLENLSWDFRAKNLFLNIPDINTGDIIEVTWNGEKYRYRVAALTEDVNVDRQADIMLITCKYYDSDIRYFVYGTRL